MSFKNYITEKESSIKIGYVPETGLISVEQNKQVVELVKEDIEDIYKLFKKKKVASNKDF